MGGLILSQAWSPDGQTLVFSRFKDKQHNLYRVNVDGTHLLQLTSAPTATLDAFNVEPAWSPDGQQIVFASDRDGAFSEIYVMNADGSNPVRLTSGGAREPSWSPGGEQIAYVASPDGDKTEIYVMNADGSNQRRLTANPAYDNEPIWVRMR